MRDRMNGAMSGVNGADESGWSDGPNEQKSRSDGWVKRMERIAPPFRYRLPSSSCRGPGGGVNICEIPVSSN